MSHFVAYTLQFQEIIVYKFLPGDGERGTIASLRSKRLCYSLQRKYNIYSFNMQNLRPLPSLYSLADQFESYLVAKPKTGFLVTRLIYSNIFINLPEMKGMPL